MPFLLLSAARWAFCSLREQQLHLVLRSLNAIAKESAVMAVIGWRVRPQIHGLARRLSCLVATRAAGSISLGLAKLCPASASRRKSRHQPSCRLSQHAPVGMKT